MPKTPDEQPEVQQVISEETSRRIEAYQAKINPPKPQPTDINEILAAVGAGVQAVPASSVPPVSAPAAEPVRDGYLGAFMGGDGRYLHSYMVDGQKVILPKKQEEMTEDDWMGLSSTLHDPVSNRIPQNLTVKFRDPQWAGHWFQRTIKDGQSVRRARALGFEPAKKEDCDWLPQGLNDEDGAIIDGDLVLMKIHKIKLFQGFLAGYFREALQKGGKDGYRQSAENALGGPTSKVSHYQAAQTANEFTGLGPIGQPLAR
jgi:hypothetical protein